MYFRTSDLGAEIMAPNSALHYKNSLVLAPDLRQAVHLSTSFPGSINAQWFLWKKNQLMILMEKIQSL